MLLINIKNKTNCSKLNPFVSEGKIKDMNRKINKVAVLGSGVMGSRIACHFANIGVEVLLLDIVPKEAEDSKDAKARNKIVDDALKFALKSNIRYLQSILLSLFITFVISYSLLSSLKNPLIIIYYYKI